MRSKTGHLGHRACMHSRDLFPAYDGSVMAINRLANLQGAASSADDLAGVHAKQLAYPTLFDQAFCLGGPTHHVGKPAMISE